MVSRQFYPFLMVLICVTVGLAEEFSFPVESDYLYTCKPYHWQHPAGNSSININGIKMDVFQWRAAAKNKESVRVDLINPVWEFAEVAINDIVLPNIIEISNTVNFRGTPTVYIKVTPWRTMGNGVEVLTAGTINIWVETANFPITFDHPYLLNRKEHALQKISTVGIEYLIVCPSDFARAAQSLAEMHSSDVAAVNINTFNTEVIFTDNISQNLTGKNIRDSILHLLQINEDMKFLLLLGDETHIPPIFYNYSTSTFPSDDFYTTPADSIFIGDPQLYTGRIPISTVEDASTVVEKIREYVLNSTPGIWRSTVALVADDMHRGCALDNGENSHTEYSDILYDLLSPLIPILPFYGLHYSLQQTSSGCAYPDLTRELIQTINNGAALINYIGHGSPATWSGEKLIDKTRDLSLIHPNENRLAIWVAGTCSFGNYYGENSFMEELLLREKGAIAVLASTDLIGYDDNWHYIKSLFGYDNDQGIEDYINNGEDIRLGELAWMAKNLNEDYKFHTFGDPALPLPFPKKTTENLVIDPPDTIHLVQEESIVFNNIFSYSSILIRENEKKYLFDYGTDSLTYTVPGVTYVQMDISGNSSCFRIPLDAGSCDSCVVIQAYQEGEEWNGKIETISTISIIGSTEDFKKDSLGPLIRLSQETRNINNGSAIFPNIDLTVSLEDESGINLMKTIGHGIRYAFDDNNLVLVPGNVFKYVDCSTGSVIIPVPLSLSKGKHEFYLEAWDGLNNQSREKWNLELLLPIEKDLLLLSKVYPIPNPFSDGTHFTMYVSTIPAEITLTVYSLNGEKVRTLSDEANETFTQIPWDGKDQYGHNIANGAYFYHVRAETVNNGFFEKIYKLAKVE